MTSTADDARKLLAALPGFAEAEVEPLAAGYNNRGFRVEAGGRRYVLRVPGGERPPGSAPAEIEFAVQERAAERGLAPKIVHADAQTGVLLTEFVDGEPWTAAQLGEPARLDALAKRLRELHALPPAGHDYDPGAAGDAYLAVLSAQGEESAFAQHCRSLIAKLGRRESTACCHNDIVADNLLGGPLPTLIDFEYAGDHDPYYDLASVIGWHDLEPRFADRLLAAYAGGATAEARGRLAAQCRVFDAVQWLWLAARQAVNPEVKTARRLRTLADRLR